VNRRGVFQYAPTIVQKEKQMELLIDIGNTNISMAVVKGKHFLKHFFIHTSKKNISVLSFKRLLGKYFSDLEKIIIVSVVPDLLNVFEKVFKRLSPGIPLIVVGKDLKVPIRNRYRKPMEVGQDRLLTAFAAKGICASPVIAIDFGTAVTMDLVNKKGEYEGGLIFPGLRSALGALTDDTALLPMVALKPAEGFIGRTTRESMNNGIVLGYAAMCDGLIEKFKKKYGRSINVIATGGDAALVAKYSRHIKKIRPHLIFEGLRQIIR